MLDRNGYAELIERHPRLFHVVYRADDDSHQSVVENGLVPGVQRHNWHGLYRPRAGHVYLSTASYLSEVRTWGGWNNYPFDVYAVTTEQLTLTRLNPDEDWFRADDWITHTNVVGGRHACQHFRLPLPPTSWMWEWATYLKIHSLPSYGEWAEAVELGSDPRQTAYSFRMGSVAYHGDIAPAAVHRIFSSTGESC